MSETQLQPPQTKILEADNEAVIRHMEMYQGIITRMAGNSSACKAWGVPLIAALMGFIVQTKNQDLTILVLLIIPVLFSIDCYYLMLENQFRDGFNNSAKHLQNGTFTQAKLYKLLPMGSKEKHWSKAIASIATWPLYLGLGFLVLFGYYLAAPIK